jgi:hypothetical protein
MIQVRMSYLLWGLLALGIWMAAKAPSTLLDVLHDIGDIAFAVAKGITDGLKGVTHGKARSLWSSFQVAGNIG